MSANPRWASVVDYGPKPLLIKRIRPGSLKYGHKQNVHLYTKGYNFVCSVYSFPGVLSQQKCLKYIEMSYKRNLDSGWWWIRNRILNGEPSQISDYPHMGALGWKLRNGSYFFGCGGSLISPNFVITAAHCRILASNSVDVTSKNPQVVRLGATNIQEPETKNSRTIKIKRTITHDKYKSPQKYYDIALVELQEPVEFSNFIQPACLYVHDIDIKKPYTVTGWGQSEADSESLDFLSPELLSAKLDVFDDEECKRIIKKEKMTNRNWYKLIDHQICAGKLDGSTDTCKGDSGGPLQKLLIDAEWFKMHTIVGITSFGKACGEKGKPAIYTKVSYFLDWIEKIVWRNESDYMYNNNKEEQGVTRTRPARRGAFGYGSATLRLKKGIRCRYDEN